MTQTKPHSGSLVFWYQKISAKFDGVTPSPPTGAPDAGGVGQIQRLSTNNWLYLENGRR